MTAPPEILIRTLADVSAFAQSARRQAGGDIILVPVDFSEPSAGALNFAATLAQSIHAALIVLHVIHDPAEMPGYYFRNITRDHLERIDDVAEQTFRDFMVRMRESRPDCLPLQETGYFMVTGLPVTRILEVAAELKPLMVVMGSQGRTGIDSIMIGSKAAQIVQLCPFPVTIVKHREQPVEH
jgi:nucleotide-binding universal stress UspA family protein